MNIDTPVSSPDFIPFKISPAAEDHIRASLQSALPSELECGFVRALGYAQRSLDGELEEQFEGEHFLVAHDNREKWLREGSTVQSVICGRNFWIPRDVVEALRGKTLTVMSCDVGCGDHVGVTRDLLVSA